MNAHSSITHNSPNWKQSKCPSAGEWVNEIYIYKIEYYSAIKMNELIPART